MGLPLIYYRFHVKSIYANKIKHENEISSDRCAKNIFQWLFLLFTFLEWIVITVWHMKKKMYGQPSSPPGRQHCMFQCPSWSYGFSCPITPPKQLSLSATTWLGHLPFCCCSQFIFLFWNLHNLKFSQLFQLLFMFFLPLHIQPSLAKHPPVFIMALLPLLPPFPVPINILVSLLTSTLTLLLFDIILSIVLMLVMYPYIFINILPMILLLVMIEITSCKRV